MRVRQWSLLTMLMCTWASSAFSQLTEADVRRIITQRATRAAQISPRSVIAVTDREGYVLGVWSVHGGAVSGGEIATCVSKAGTAAFLSSDQNAFTSRTAGFIIQQHFPPGVNNTPTGPLVGVGLSSLFFSDVNHFKKTDMTPDPMAVFPAIQSPGTLGSRITGTSLDASPGGVPLYKNGHLVGGVGVTGDGTPRPPIPLSNGEIVRAENPFVFIAGYDKDEDVALAGQKGFKPSPDILASNVYINGISLEYTESSTNLPNTLILPGQPLREFPIQGSPPPFQYPVATFGGVQGQIRQQIVSDPLPGTINGQPRLTATEVRRIISFAADRARTTRGGIRLPIGSQMQVFISVVNFPNQNGAMPTVLGTFRTGEATVFSWDVAVQKARTALAYSNNGNRMAMSTRTVGFLAQSHYPPGIDADRPGPFFGQQEIASGFLGTAPNVVVTGPPFPPNTNLPNGITIFPGGFPLYRNGQLIGAIGISGDGVDQDDIVGASGTHDFPAPEAIQADSFVFRGARLPYAKFPRDPTGVTRSNDAVIMSLPHALMTRAGLANVSSRTNVGVGDNVMIAGFVITGQSPKKILLRGLGPSLAQFHLTNVLPDPVLELHKPGGAVVVNDNWKSTQQSEIQATGISPSHELDSAIVLTLNPGAYSAVLRGKNGATGVGLVEVYDLTPTSNSILTNISTRGFVGTMDNILIGGFIVGANNGAAKVLVRAVGPSLTRFGITHPLSDPMLEIHNANGAMITTNDNWSNPQFAEISASALAPSDARESAVLGWLPSGAYTAVVRGKNQQTGIGLIEVYCTQ